MAGEAHRESYLGKRQRCWHESGGFSAALPRVEELVYQCHSRSVPLNLFIEIDIRSHRLKDSADNGKILFPMSVEVLKLKPSTHKVFECLYLFSIESYHGLEGNGFFRGALYQFTILLDQASTVSADKAMSCLDGETPLYEVSFQCARRCFSRTAWEFLEVPFLL
jgi:hypothetical protein